MSDFTKAETRTKKGTRVQQFQARHERFLPLWADGLHPLEISQQLHLSPNQLWRHIARAVEDRAPRTEPEYSCVLWETLPPALKKVLPSCGEKALVRVLAENGRVVLDLVAPKAPELQPY